MSCRRVWLSCAHVGSAAAIVSRSSGSSLLCFIFLSVFSAKILNINKLCKFFPRKLFDYDYDDDYDILCTQRHGVFDYNDDDDDDFLGRASPSTSEGTRERRGEGTRTYLSEHKKCVTDRREVILLRPMVISLPRTPAPSPPRNKKTR